MSKQSDRWALVEQVEQGLASREQPERSNVLELTQAERCGARLLARLKRCLRDTAIEWDPTASVAIEFDKHGDAYDVTLT
eukprot:8037248-Alexandrium_andersonii.AAC.1